MNRIKKFARQIRKRPTPAEEKIWRWLRDRRFSGIKFRRQHAIGGYIPDFYCWELKLAIELDGAGHHWTYAAEMRDVDRDCELSKLGITVLRISNEDVMKDPVHVGQRILLAVQTLTRRSAPPSPARGRGRS